EWSRVRPQELSMGCRARKVRTPAGQGQKRTMKRLFLAGGPGGCQRAGYRISLRVLIRAGPTAPRMDVVPLDHLVQRRRLDMKQLGRPLLDATRGLERRFNQPLLE